MNDPEFLKALEMVAEYDQNRPPVLKEFRLYYDDSGSIVGLWESDFPDSGNYIVLDDPAKFHKTNTALLKVVDGKLTRINPKAFPKTRLIKSSQGFPVVKGQAALLLDNEEYPTVEHYARKTDN